MDNQHHWCNKTYHAKKVYWFVDQSAAVPDESVRQFLLSIYDRDSTTIDGLNDVLSSQAGT